MKKDEMVSGFEVLARVIAVSFNSRSGVRRLSRMVGRGNVEPALCGCADPDMAQT